MSKRLQGFTIALNDRLRAALDAAAAADRISRGEFIRRALEVEFARRPRVKTPASTNRQDAAMSHNDDDRPLSDREVRLLRTALVPAFARRVRARLHRAAPDHVRPAGVVGPPCFVQPNRNRAMFMRRTA